MYVIYITNYSIHRATVHTGRHSECKNTWKKVTFFFFFFLNILYFTSSQYYTIILSISFYFRRNLNFLSDSSYLALFYRYRKFINFEFRILSPSRISEFWVLMQGVNECSRYRLSLASWFLLEINSCIFVFDLDECTSYPWSRTQLSIE